MLLILSNQALQLQDTVEDEENAICSMCDMHSPPSVSQSKTIKWIECCKFWMKFILLKHMYICDVLRGRGLGFFIISNNCYNRKYTNLAKSRVQLFISPELKKMCCKVRIRDVLYNQFMISHWHSLYIFSKPFQDMCRTQKRTT